MSTSSLHSSRRQFMAGAAAVIAATALSPPQKALAESLAGATTFGAQPLDPKKFTIDVHCHIFNGTDLPIESFIHHVAIQNALGEAAGYILQHVNWTLAPEGDNEIAKLQGLVHAGTNAAERANLAASLSDDSFQRAKKAVSQLGDQQAIAPVPLRLQSEIAMLRAPLPNSADGPKMSNLTDADALSTRDKEKAQQQIIAYFRMANSEDELLKLANPADAAIPILPKKSAPKPMIEGGVAPIAEAAQTQDAATQAEESRSAAVTAAATQTHVHVIAMCQFIAQYFRYRYTSVSNYLNTFTPAAGRDVDLMLASMIDYDWWLNGGSPPRTPLKTQVEVMRLISIATSGRVHGFAPFCPLREVAFRAGKTDNDGNPTWSSLQFVQDAVLNKGCVGIKLYPPMGFAPYGNSALDLNTDGTPRHFWVNPLLPAWLDGPIVYPPNMGGGSARLGVRMDEVLDELYAWCETNGVPLLAHSAPTNTPDDKYKPLPGETYWVQTLKSRHPQLRVNFAHLGGLDASEGLTPPATSVAFLETLGDSPHTYGDSAYNAAILHQKVNFDERLETLYARYPVFPSRFVYGTDWSLLLQEGQNKEYLKDFQDEFSRLDGVAACPAHKASECFFAWNAVDYIGLRKTDAARLRLTKFYADNHVAQPVWVSKLNGA